MHKINARYEENNCDIIIDGAPYIILNLEIYTKYSTKSSRLSHCDFLYIRAGTRNSRIEHEVFLVELKNISGNRNEDIIRTIKSFINNKYPGTCGVLEDFLKTLGLTNNYSIYGILVLPQNVIDELYEHEALVKRHKIKFKNCWIVSCCTKLKEKAYPRS